jgi:pimeloyl-ACP methyl ester carboxylesterase
VVAPDLRGYGDTKGPADPEAYTNLHVVGDMVMLLDALGEKQAVIVGHDWGSPVAWMAATLRPDRFRAVASLSVMNGPRMPLPPPEFAVSHGMKDLYWLYFQTPGVAERDMERDTRETFLRLFYGVSGDAFRKGESWNLRVGEAGLIAALVRPDRLPDWLPEAELARYAETYARTGFTTSLNWYRCMARTWQLSAAWADLPVTVPALFIGGKADPTLTQLQSGTDAMRAVVPNLRGVVMVEAGHWVQQEDPDAVSRGLIGFLKEL